MSQHKLKIMTLIDACEGGFEDECSSNHRFSSFGSERFDHRFNVCFQQRQDVRACRDCVRGADRYCRIHDRQGQKGTVKQSWGAVSLAFLLLFIMLGWPSPAFSQATFSPKRWGDYQVTVVEKKVRVISCLAVSDGSIKAVDSLGQEVVSSIPLPQGSLVQPGYGDVVTISPTAEQMPGESGTYSSPETTYFSNYYELVQSSMGNSLMGQVFQQHGTPAFEVEVITEPQANSYREVIVKGTIKVIWHDFVRVGCDEVSGLPGSSSSITAIWLKAGSLTGSSFQFNQTNYTGELAVAEWNRQSGSVFGSSQVKDLGTFSSSLSGMSLSNESTTEFWVLALPGNRGSLDLTAEGAGWAGTPTKVFNWIKFVFAFLLYAGGFLSCLWAINHAAAEAAQVPQQTNTIVVVATGDLTGVGNTSASVALTKAKAGLVLGVHLFLWFTVLAFVEVKQASYGWSENGHTASITANPIKTSDAATNAIINGAMEMLERFFPFFFAIKVSITIMVVWLFADYFLILAGRAIQMTGA